VEYQIMSITLHLITGMMLGVEYVQGDPDWKHCVVFDLLIVRVMFHWGADDVDS
jgi:uncharacterized protein (DUF983 family)